MLLTTKGIVLHSIKYSDNSLISKVFTEDKGLLSLISSNSKRRADKGKVYFQALTEIDLVLYFKQNSKLHRLKEVSFVNKTTPISQNMSVTAIKFFLAEILSLHIKEEEGNAYLYHFLSSKVNQLNNGTFEARLFHIDFLYDFSQYLGVQPNFSEKASHFDLVEGQMVQEKPTHEHYILAEDCSLIHNYFYNNYAPTKLEAKKILSILLEYYQIQLGNVSQLKSKTILEMVFA